MRGGLGDKLGFGKLWDNFGRWRDLEGFRMLS
jgi:hypothetical protein